jgi:hypothetical protein
MSTNQRAMEYLIGLARNGFWGAVTIKFEGGQAVHISRQESIIPSKLKEEPKNNVHFNNQ